MNPLFVRAVLTLLQLVWTHPLSEPAAPSHAGVDAAGRVSPRHEAGRRAGAGASAIPPPRAPVAVGPAGRTSWAREAEAEGHVSVEPTKLPPPVVLDGAEGHASAEPNKFEAEGHVSAEPNKFEAEGHASAEPTKFEPEGHASAAQTKVEAEGLAGAEPTEPPPPVEAEAARAKAALEPEASEADAKFRSIMRRAELHAMEVASSKAVDEVVEVRGDCLPAEVLNPPEKSRTYSSVYRNYAPGTYHARSMLDSPLGWQASKSLAGESMTIDLGSVHVVHGTVTQGRAIERHPEWVEKYTVQYSVNGEVWRDADKTFKGNNDSDTKVENHFDGAVRARFVKLTVKSWHSHISMRAGVLTCEPCAAGPTINPPEESRRYSSVLGGHIGTVGELHARSALNSSSAWTPARDRAGEWMVIDLGRPEVIRGTVLQGANSTIPSWVVTYRVQLSMDGKMFKDVGEVFLGNWDDSSDSEQLFGVPMRAQYLRLVVEKWHGSISMRAGVLTCSR